MTSVLTRGSRLSKAIIWPLLCDNWKTVRDRTGIGCKYYSLSLIRAFDYQ